MENHPEQKKNEVFLGNAEKSRGHHSRYSHLKTIRVGKQAYCIKGTIDGMSEMVPLFVGKSELNEYNKIWGQSLKNEVER